MKFYTLIFGAFAFFIGGVIVLNHGRPPGELPDSAPSGEAVMLAKCQHIVKQLTRDPSAVKWNECVSWVKDGKTHASIDFTALNGFGGPVRETWFFTTDQAGKLVSLLTPKGEQLK